MTTFVSKWLQLSAIWLMPALGGAALAAAEPPEAMVSRTVEEVLQAIRQNPDRAALQEVAEQKVLPRFDFREMTRLAVGANWRKATPEQQAALENSFRRLLVNLYTSSLASSGRSQGERKLEVKPVPHGAPKDDVLVKTVVKESGGPRVAIDYRMASRDGQWKVYDVLVEGVSLVTTYRTSFEGEVAKGGVEGLIRTLEQKNQGSSKS